MDELGTQLFLLID